jgi:hypothetical protein
VRLAPSFDPVDEADEAVCALPDRCPRRYATTYHLPPTTHHVSHRDCSPPAAAAAFGEWSFEGAAELTASLLQVMSGTRLCLSTADLLFEIARLPRPVRRSRHGSCLATSRLLPVPPGRASTPPLSLAVPLCAASGASAVSAIMHCTLFQNGRCVVICGVVRLAAHSTCCPKCRRRRRRRCAAAITKVLLLLCRRRRRC